jgi:hypothetical protein
VAGITLAWLIGEGIIIWRQVGKQHHAPIPGTLLGSSGFFALLALVAEYQPARAAATLTAFGVDLAAYLQVPLVTPKATAGGTAATPKVATSGPVPHS